MSYFLTLPIDRSYERKHERSQQALAERGKKIFDPIRSKQAYDVADLHTQMADKKKRERAETMRNLTFDQAAHRLDAAHHAIAARERELKRSALQQVQQYRTSFQRREDSLSHELNDPDYLKKQRPLTLDHCDPEKFGPSALLTFESDKLRTPVDIKNSIARQRDYLAVQLEEAKQKKDKERHEDNVKATEFSAQQAKLQAVDNAVSELQKATALATKKYNEALAATQEDHRRRAKEWNEQDEKAHVYNTLNGDFMNEKSDHPRDWRGMSEGQLQSITEERAKQVQERRNLKNQEREETCSWDNYFRNVENKALTQTAKLDDERRAIRKRFDELNKHLAEESREREEFEKIAREGAVPSTEWFNQFGRNPR